MHWLRYTDSDAFESTRSGIGAVREHEAER
jgi:hypothetical protein